MDDERRQMKPSDLWRILLGIVAVIAIIQELLKPKEERTWHGKVASFFPYDFRRPTMERVRTTYWDPDGPLVGGKVFGVGWALNFGALTAMFRRSPEPAASSGD
jgi:hypothetical protein